MNRLTAAIIANDENVYASFFGPVDGKFGLYIGTMDEAPSGHKRPRDLLSSQPIYLSQKEAKNAAQEIIDSVKKSAREERES